MRNLQQELAVFRNRAVSERQGTRVYLGECLSASKEVVVLDGGVGVFQSEIVRVLKGGVFRGVLWACWWCHYISIWFHDNGFQSFFFFGPLIKT